MTGQGTINTIGNPNLEPEESVNTEVGVYYENYNGFDANITLFHNDFKNKITSESIDDYTSTYTNVGKAKTQGVEFSTKFPLFIDSLTLRLNYTYTDSEQKDGDNKGAKLTNTPEHMANAKLNWSVNEKLDTWLRAEYRDKTSRFTSKYENLSAANKLVYDELGGTFKSYTVFNLGATYKLSNDITLNGAINNLFDKDFTKTHVLTSGRTTTTAGDYFTSSQTTTGNVIPGRSLWVSATINF